VVTGKLNRQEFSSLRYWLNSCEVQKLTPSGVLESRVGYETPKLHGTAVRAN
jgi:hypothetical protein